MKEWITGLITGLAFASCVWSAAYTKAQVEFQKYVVDLTRPRP